MRYRNYSKLLTAAEWMGFRLTFLDPGLVELQHGDLILWVDIPFLWVDAGDWLRIRKGRLTPTIRKALGITGIDWRFFKR